jgi:hypothetical protein
LALDAAAGGGGGGGGGGGAGKSSGTADRHPPRLGYRLVDASRGRADSALEVLVGRSLGRIDAPSSSSAGAADEEYDGGGGDGDDDAYHVMIKVWHTHLGYERTVMSVRA